MTALCASSGRHRATTRRRPDEHACTALHSRGAGISTTCDPPRDRSAGSTGVKGELIIGVSRQVVQEWTSRSRFIRSMFDCTTRSTECRTAAAVARWSCVASSRELHAGSCPRARPRHPARRRHARAAQRDHRRRRRARRTHDVVSGDTVRTGVTAILPHGGNLFREKVPGAVFVGNAFGKLAGSTQVQELGTIESPIVLTNTLGVGVALDAVVALDARAARQRERALRQRARRRDQRRRRSTTSAACQSRATTSRRRSPARASGAVDEGAVGAGTGTVAFGWKGGIGTSSRRVTRSRTTLDRRRARAVELRRPADDRRRAGVARADADRDAAHRTWTAEQRTASRKPRALEPTPTAPA